MKTPCFRVCFGRVVGLTMLGVAFALFALTATTVGCNSTPKKQLPSNPWVKSDRKAESTSSGSSGGSSKQDDGRPKTVSSWLTQQRTDTSNRQ